MLKCHKVIVEYITICYRFAKYNLVYKDIKFALLPSDNQPSAFVNVNRINW